MNRISILFALLLLLAQALTVVAADIEVNAILLASAGRHHSSRHRYRHQRL